MNPNNSEMDTQPVDCCICLNAMAPFQALFLAPCSHCYHFKCVTPLLGAGYMFQCPMCRQVANLEATVVTDDVSEMDETEQPLEDELAFQLQTDLNMDDDTAPTSPITAFDQTLRRPPRPNSQEASGTDEEGLMNGERGQPMEGDDQQASQAHEHQGMGDLQGQGDRVQGQEEHGLTQDQPPSSSHSSVPIPIQQPRGSLTNLSPSTPANYSWALDQQQSDESAPLVLYKLLTSMESHLAKGDADATRAVCSAYHATLSKMIDQACESSALKTELLQLLHSISE